jgi:Na+-driven multidrug efflux pump
MSRGQGAHSSRIRELTVGNVRSQVFGLAVPATVESALQTTVRLLDTYWMDRPLYLDMSANATRSGLTAR